MNLFELITRDIIYLIFPLIIYLFYVAHNQNIGKKENDLFLELSLLTSIYLSLRFCNDGSDIISLAMINIILMVAYLKERHISSVIISIIFIVYANLLFDFNIIILLINYMFYYALYIYKQCKPLKKSEFINMFILIECLFVLLLLFKNNPSCYFLNQNIVPFILLFVMIFLISHGVLLLFSWCETVVELHITVKELEQEKQIRTSLFKITHEIKNPLAVCKGYLDMYDTYNIDHGKKYIPILKEEVQRALLILEDFQYVSKDNLHKDILDINLLLDDITNSMQMMLFEKKVELKYDKDDEEIFIEGDFNRLKQVLINLVKNSVEAFSDNENNYIHIYKKNQNHHILICIEDNGIGITKQNLIKLKEAFFTTKSYGTGLGVYLSNEIIEAHDGKLDYTSKGGITTVTIKLPLMNQKTSI